MPPGLLALRPAGRLYAANAKNVTAKLVAVVDAADPPPKVVVLDAVAIPDLEYTALVALRELGDEARARGIERWIAGLSDQDRRMFERYGLGPGVRIFATLDDAVAAYLTRTG
jgi:sulfate permease, SulP family